MKKDKQVILSGVQPTQGLHLGNLLGALRNWTEWQNDHTCFFFVGDLHAITLRQDPEVLRQNSLRAVATYLAAGIDPSKSTVFLQSDVPAHAELSWVLTCISTMGELSRMTQYKEKSSKQAEGIPTGLFVYPALMAADILLYQTHFVPVGQDQKQHIELARDLAERANKWYNATLFRIPEPLSPKVGAKIMSLLDPESKMSKSDPTPGATIFLTDSDDMIRNKFKRAVTDSGKEVTEKDISPGVENLLQIQAALQSKPLSEVHKSYVGRQYGYLKLETADIVIQTLAPMRDRVVALLEDPSELQSHVVNGGEKARVAAETTLRRVYEAVGLHRRQL